MKTTASLSLVKPLLLVAAVASTVATISMETVKAQQDREQQPRRLRQRRDLRGETEVEYMGNDLGIRFSKVEFFDENNKPPGAHLPFRPEDFPISMDDARWLRDTQAVSIITEEECPEHECNIPFETLIESVGGLPSHPSDNPKHQFWDELCEVVEMQENRIAGVDPLSVMPLPKIWDGYDIHDVAEAVHDEVRVPTVTPDDLAGFFLFLSHHCCSCGGCAMLLWKKRDPPLTFFCYCLPACLPACLPTYVTSRRSIP